MSSRRHTPLGPAVQSWWTSGDSVTSRKYSFDVCLMVRQYGVDAQGSEDVPVPVGAGAEVYTDAVCARVPLVGVPGDVGFVVEVGVPEGAGFGGPGGPAPDGTGP